MSFTALKVAAAICICPAVATIPLATKTGRKVYAHALHRVANRIAPPKKAQTVYVSTALPCLVEPSIGGLAGSAIPYSFVGPGGRGNTLYFGSDRQPIRTQRPGPINLPPPPVGPQTGPDAPGGGGSLPPADGPPLTTPDEPPVITPPVTPVPEPATWAMMLLGFGTVGVAARKRMVRA